MSEAPTLKQRSVHIEIRADHMSPGVWLFVDEYRYPTEGEKTADRALGQRVSQPELQPLLTALTNIAAEDERPAVSNLFERLWADFRVDVCLLQEGVHERIRRINQILRDSTISF
jgi:hypothetical protein